MLEKWVEKSSMGQQNVVIFEAIQQIKQKKNAFFGGGQLDLFRNC